MCGGLLEVVVLGSFRCDELNVFVNDVSKFEVIRMRMVLVKSFKL